MPVMKPSCERYTIDDLLRIMEILRSDQGCPWDRIQTHESIRMNFIEEVYEAIEAIDQKDPVLLREELGDVLLQVVFHARMEQEAGRFAFSDVVHDVCHKLVIRHPHIFDEHTAANPTEALANWNEIKQKTKGQKNGTDTLLSVAKTLPGLMRAEKIQSRSQKAGVPKKSKEEILECMEQQLAALRTDDNTQEQQRLLGKMLFNATMLTHTYDYSAEELLERESNRYIHRFAKLEENLAFEGKRIKDCDPRTICSFMDQDDSLNL